MYENVHPNLALVLLFVRTEVECGKGLLKMKIHVNTGVGLIVLCVVGT